MWEKFTVTFTVFHPFQDANDAMRIAGSTPALGDWNPNGRNPK